MTPEQGERYFSSLHLFRFTCSVIDFIDRFNYRIALAKALRDYEDSIGQLRLPLGGRFY